MRLALRLALRELRGGTRGLRVVLMCLVLGVAAIASVGVLREGLARGLAQDGRRILGGDLAIEGGSQPLPDTLRDWFRTRGDAISDTVTLRSMMLAGRERLLVELKAVDAAWPLVGSATLADGSPLRPALANGAVVEPLVLDRLHAAPGSTLRLGTSDLAAVAVLGTEPDRVADPSIFGPRVLIGLDRLDATGLVRPGSIVEHHLRATLASGQDAIGTIEAVKKVFPNTGWRFRDAAHAAPGVQQFIDRTALFLTLVGLASLLVGGVGVANGVRAWIEARRRTLATLRCLGAAPALVIETCAIQLGLLAAAGIVVGLVLGVALPWLAVTLAGDLLPVRPVIAPFPRPLAEAALFGALTAAAFAATPLATVGRVPGATLFRAVFDALPASRTARLVTAGLGLALVGLTVATAQDRLFAAGFCAAALLTLGLFRLGAAILVRVAARLPSPRKVWARLALSALYRPGTSAPLMLVSVGMGLSVLSAVALIEGNMQRQVAEQLPRDAPSFFFVDIQPGQLDRFKGIVGAQPGTRDVKTVPSLRARLVSVAGVPADQVKATPDTRWALQGDRGLTIAGAEPEATRLTAGTWWAADYAGPPLVSFDTNLAAGWGVHVGDTMRVNVLGRDIDLKVANLRDIAWRTMGLNFTMVVSPGLLSAAPYSNIATLRSPEASQTGLLAAVTDALPNVSGIRIADVIGAVTKILGQLGTALAAAGSLTLVSGALVLAGAVAGTQRRRIAEAVVLKTLGASRATIRAGWLLEFGILGTVAGLLAALVGTLSSWAVMRWVLQADWVFLPTTLAATVLGCVALMLVVGWAGTASALSARPAPLLRNE